MSLEKMIFMKKIFTLASFIILAANFSHAQFTPGQKVLGGNLGFSTGKSEYPFSSPNSSSYTNFSVNPSIATFKKANVLQGVSLSYDFRQEKNRSSNNSVNKINNHSVGIGFFRQRFFPLAPKLYFTVNGSIGASYNFGKGTTILPNLPTSETLYSGYGVGFGVSPGLSYQLSKRVLFDAGLSNLLSVSFSHNQAKSGSLKSTSNQFNLSSSLSNTNLGSVSLGFRLLLKK